MILVAMNLNQAIIWFAECIIYFRFKVFNLINIQNFFAIYKINFKTPNASALIVTLLSDRDLDP